MRAPFVLIEITVAMRNPRKNRPGGFVVCVGNFVKSESEFEKVSVEHVNRVDSVQRNRLFLRINNEFIAGREVAGKAELINVHIADFCVELRS